MKQNTWTKPTMSLVVSLMLALLMGFAAMPAGAEVQRVVFASAGVDESNRFWVVSRPNQRSPAAVKTIESLGDGLYWHGWRIAAHENDCGPLSLQRTKCIRQPLA